VGRVNHILHLGKHLKWYLEKIGITPMCYDIIKSNEINYNEIDLTVKESLKKIMLDID